MTRTYPYTAWALPPSFKPKQVTFVRNYWNSDVADSGTLYARHNIFPTKADAIAAGRQSLERQRIDLDKKLANLAKKHAALDAAEKETT